MKNPLNGPCKTQHGMVCIALLIGLSLSACGNPGALYLPEQPAPVGNGVPDDASAQAADAAANGKDEEDEKKQREATGNPDGA